MSRRAVWGAVGRAVIVTAPIAAVLYLGYAAAGLPFAPFDVFDWMARVLPGSLVRFGVDTMVNLLLLLGLNVKDTAKTAEQLQAILGFLVTLGVVGTVFLVALRERRSRAVPAYGGELGLLVAVPIIVVVLSVYGTAKVSRDVGTACLLGVFTLSCISNPVAGPLISTTLWTGVPLADVLADAGVREGAKYVQMHSEDGFYETLSLELVRAEPGIMLVHSFNGRPLPEKHGYPLRIHIPNRYGMKQPKWIVALEVTEEYREGYWVERGWSEEATVRTTSVIDAVAVDDPIKRGGQTYIQVGGIAYAGARGISAVEVKVDEGPWQPAEIRQALSDRTWVVWRYEWPFAEGEHSFTVRCVGGEGTPQLTEEAGTFPDGAAGLHSRKESL